MNTRKTILALSVLAGALIGSAAQARDAQVQWQVTVDAPVIRLPGHVSLPLPPLLVPRIVVGNSAPGHDHPNYRQERDAGYWQPGPQDRGYHDRGYRESGYREPRRWDVDGDGVPNRYDRVYNPRWDRDGDGTPNRYDRRPDNPRDARGGRDDRDRGGYHHGRRD